MPAGRSRKPPSKVAVAISLVIFGLLLLFPIFAFGVAPHLEQNVTTTWRCDVTSAEPREASSGLRGSTTLPSVLLRTTDCGDIVLHKGVTFDNSATLAADVRPGIYDLKVGWVSANIIRFIPNGLVEVQSYEPAP